MSAQFDALKVEIARLQARADKPAVERVVEKTVEIPAPQDPTPEEVQAVVDSLKTANDAAEAPKA